MKPRHSHFDRRRIAYLHQIDGLSVRKIAARGFQKSIVQRWCNIDVNGPDSLFDDRYRCGRPQIYKQAKRVKIAKNLEKDTRNVARTTAEEHKVGVSTVYRIAKVMAPLVPCESEVVLTEEIKKKRVVFAQVMRCVNVVELGFADHTLVSVPPKTMRRKVFRRPNSKKPVPKTPKYKFSTNFLVYLAACAKGIAPPICAVRKRKLKICRKGQKSRGYTWETLKVKEKDVRLSLTQTFFPFFRQKGVTTVLLDNAPVQDQLEEFIAEEGFRSPGFACKRVNDVGGFPPNSPDFMLLDAVVNNVFKKEWSKRQPMTLCQGVRVAKEIVHDLNKTQICRKYVLNWQKLCDEVIASGGEASHHMH